MEFVAVLSLPGKRVQKLGRTVKLMAPRFVKPYLAIGLITFAQTQIIGMSSTTWTSLSALFWLTLGGLCKIGINYLQAP